MIARDPSEIREGANERGGGVSRRTPRARAARDQRGDTWDTDMRERERERERGWRGDKRETLDRIDVYNLSSCINRRRVSISERARARFSRKRWGDGQIRTGLHPFGFPGSLGDDFPMDQLGLYISTRLHDQDRARLTPANEGRRSCRNNIRLNLITLALKM